MVQLSSGGRQSLLVATGMHSEAAVTTAPVVAVGGEAEGTFGNEKNSKNYIPCHECYLKVF